MTREELMAAYDYLMAAYLRIAKQGPPEGNPNG